MKITEARAKAKELFGVGAFAKISRYNGKKYVGARVLVGKFLVDNVFGYGSTWEEAFDNAKLRDSSTGGTQVSGI